MENQTKKTGQNPSPNGRHDSDEILLEQIKEAINSIQFGTVQLIVQNSRVVQIDKTEKIRLV